VYRIVNLGGYLGELPAPTEPKKTADSGAASPATYGCPFTPPPAPGTAAAAFAVTTDPTLNCMKDARGNTVCSDGSHYPPGCPHTPPPEVFSPGITPDVTTNGRIEGQIPAPRGGGSAGAAAAPAAGGTAAAPSSGPSPVLMAGAGALGAAILAVGSYFLFLKK
jgi:hypothetical protein